MNVTIDEAARELQQAAEQADIIILNEFSEAWREREEGRFKKQFPHGYVTWINDNIEKMAIFSRQPFHVQQRSGRVEKNAHLRLLFPSLGLTMFVFHGLTPVNEFAKTERDWELSRIARELKRMHSPSMIIGDFNQTPYATRFQNALREGDLHLAPFPEGIKPTWPDSWYSMPLEIPLDHLLVNLNVRICKREVIPITGSDHSAVMNVLQLLPEKLDFSDQKNVTPPPKMRLKIKTSPAS
jgi:endonuclease/exonuclease/phosphatase (EEP) superfamily protein YafD